MNFSDPQSLLGPLCALGSSLTWALGSSVYARQAGRVGAMEVNFSRAAIASPLFFVVAMLSGGLASIGGNLLIGAEAGGVGRYRLDNGTLAVGGPVVEQPDALGEPPEVEEVGRARRGFLGQEER